MPQLPGLQVPKERKEKGEISMISIVCQVQGTIKNQSKLRRRIAFLAATKLAGGKAFVK